MLGCDEVRWDEVFGACGRHVRAGEPDRLVELRLLELDLPGVRRGEVLTYEFAVELDDVQPGVTDIPPAVTLEPVRSEDWLRGLADARAALAARLAGVAT